MFGWLALGWTSCGAAAAPTTLGLWRIGPLMLLHHLLWFLLEHLQELNLFFFMTFLKFNLKPFQRKVLILLLLLRVILELKI
jgi:hypothetical protein